jgi:chromate transporter
VRTSIGSDDRRLLDDRMESGAAQTNNPASSRSSLYELASLFLRLGATAMGGPAVHIAMMEEEVVTRRSWLTREEFLDVQPT